MEGTMRICYDEEGDYLTLFVGDPRPNYGEEIREDITLFKDNEIDEIIGVGILNFRERVKSLNDTDLKLPFKVNFSTLNV